MAPPKPLSRGQPAPKALLEIQRALENYKIILDKAVLTDKKLGGTTQALFRVIFENYVPKLQQDFGKIKTNDRNELAIGCSKAFKDLEGFRDKTRQPERGPVKPQGYIHPHESPLVLLLTVALENGEIPLRLLSHTDPQGHTGDGLNWGKLWYFPRYLEACKFQSTPDDNGVKYWPGLPHCVMTSLPIQTIDNTGGALVSASVDKIIRADEFQKEAKNLRRRRFGRLRSECPDNVRNQIDFVKGFSEQLFSAFNRDPGSPGTPNINEVRERYLQSRSTNCDARDLQSYDLQPGYQLPVYLSIVASVWTPDGKYKPACFLDRLRFCVLRPPEGEKQENEITEQMNRRRYRGEQNSSKFSIPAATACAEWDAFITIFSQLDG
ncbi:hypothetical protein NUW58_g6154 [Xylaria curta]|uniref:Uncharacterized protein n=1 Tax=Xylaria curta TaxID=42375 RepID=A0ACC1NXD0_9PEZI|nr:hypothetical protein NUW58_g6154 [Xylaria curta]